MLSLKSTIKAHKMISVWDFSGVITMHERRHFLFMLIHSLDVSELCKKAPRSCDRIDSGKKIEILKRNH